MDHKDILYLSRVLLRHSRLWHRIRFNSRKQQIEESIIEHYGDNLAPKRKAEIVAGMKDALINYHWDIHEYFLFDYEHLTPEERKSYVSDYEKNVFCDQVNDQQQSKILRDKWKTYEKFKTYFKRDAVLVSSIQELSVSPAADFLKCHGDFILKPLGEACGRGIQIVKGKTREEVNSIVEGACKNGPCILEELINQSEELAVFHPSSVNTLRLRTFKTKDGVEIVHPAMRLGQGDSFVDNAGSGGILIDIDAATGITTAAVDKSNQVYIEHPDSHLPLIGFLVPRWEEAVEMAKELTNVLPKVKYVGWDLALTDKGWVLVEGNDRGQMGFQYVLRKGFRPELEALKKKM